MTRKRSSPMGLEIYLPVLLAFIMLPLLAQAAPLQDYTEIQQYTEGCYYNYNHYNEGDRIMTNEPCLNCTCHNKMLMCYLRVCPFTKPIGHDCIVEKREDQCCPIVTCPEVPVDVAHSAPEPGTELSFPEKFGCSIDGKFYLEGAQVPSNPNKPCELCYCIKNRTSCLMQECTLHIDGCTPIYNRGSCCPVRYNCDHENDVLELEDHSTTTEAATSTTTTERPTTGFIIASTMSPSVSTDCVHNGELYADGARIPGETACENCYCMRGDIICAVQECQMPMLNSNGKSCHALPAAEGECCPSNYECEDDSSTTQIIEATTLPYGGLDAEDKVTTAAPVKDLHSGIPEEDLQLQTHIDEEETATKMPATDSKTEEEIEKATSEEEPEATTVAAAADINEPVTQAPSTADELPEISTTSAEDEVKTEAPHAEVSEAPIHKDKNQQVGEIKPSAEEEPITTVPISELPEISTDAIASGEEDATETSATGKPEIEDSVTEIPTADNVEMQQVPEVSTDSTEEEEEAKPVAGDEYATSAPVSDKDLASTKTPLAEEDEHKPEESDEDITEGPFTAEHTTGIFEESSTKASVAIGEQESEHITETPEEYAEKEQELSSEETDELSTSTAPSTATAEEEKEPQSIVTEEDSTVTEIVPGKLSPEAEEDISTERPEDGVKQDEKEGEEEEEHENVTEKDIHETTQSDDESKPLSVDELSSTSMPAIETGKEPAATDMSTESEESEIATKAPISEDEDQESVTSSPHVEQEEKDEETSDYVPTKVSTLVPSDSTEEEDIKGPADISEDKKDEEGSGESTPVADDDQEIDRVTKVPEEEHAATPAADEDKHVLADELGSGDHTTEVSIGQEEASQPSIIVSSTEGDHVALDESTENKLPESETPTTSTETSEESAESEEDTKLMDLTTAKPSAEHIDVTTIKPSTKIDITTSATEASEEITEKEIEISTIEPIADKVETEEEQATGKPVTIDDKLPTDEITDKVEAEEATTQKPIEDSVQQTTVVPTVDIAIETEEETIDKIIPESDDHTDELSAGITDRPILITGEETDKEQDAESTTSAAKLEEEAESTTTRLHGEPTLIEETPDMQLPSVIPGEGDCLVGQKTYHNNSIIPTSDECEIVCKCVSSIVSCERVQCEVPENIEKCVLDESSTNKCCPSYICETESLPPKGSIDSIESAEQDEDEEIPYTTIAAPHKLPEHTTVVEETEEKSEISTVKPSVVAEDVSPAISIPEIEMPIASTEEPMSHVKHEDEDFDTHATKAPAEVFAEDKKDTYPEVEEHTTPSAVIEDIFVPQSMAPVQVNEQEQQHTVTDKQPTDTVEKEIKPEISAGQQVPETEKETKPEISVDQQEPETALHEETTAASVESVTDSTPASFVPSADEYQTVKPIEEEKEEEEEGTSGELIDHTGKPIVIEDLDAITPTSEEDSKPESETLAPSAPSEAETTEHVSSDEKESQPEIEAEIPTSTSSTDEKTDDHTVVPSVSSEEDKMSEIPEDHTASTEEEDKETAQEAEIQTPAPSELEKDTETGKPLDASEDHTLAPSSEVASEHTVAPAVEELEETSEEIQMSTSVPTKDAEKDEQEPSSTESLEDTSSVPSKVHDTDTDNEEDITRTTAIPSIEDTKDHDITSEHTVLPSLAEDETTATITPVSEKGKEPTDVPEISSSSTIAPALDQDKDEHTIAPASEGTEEDISATTASVISPVEAEEQDHVTDGMEFSTIIPGTEDKLVENVTVLEGETLEHTVAPAVHDEFNESSEETIDEQSATVAPVGEVDENKSEEQTPAPISTDHTIAPTAQESAEETEEKDISTETLDIATHKPIDFETKIDTSSQVPSTDDVQTPAQENIDKDIATATVIPEEEEEVSEEDHTQASSTDKYEGEQTESTLVDQKQQPTPGSTTEESESVASVDNVTVPSEEEHKQQPTLAPATEESESVPSVDNIDVSSEEEEGEQDEKENITIPSIVEDKKELEEAMAHTVAPSVQEEEENVTKHPVAADELKPEDVMEHVTSEPSIPSTITEETSTSAVPVEKDVSDEQKPVSSAEEYSTAQPSIEMESTHAPSKQPSLDLSEEASGESEESEEEISTEPTKIQHIGEFVTERVDEATVKPIDTAVSSEDEKEASGEEDEIPSSTEKPYQPTVEDDQSVIKPDDVSVSTDKLPEEEIAAAVTKAPEDITDEDTTAQQPQEEIIPSVADHDTEDTTAHVPEEQDSFVSSGTKAPLTEQDIEDTSAQQPEEPESVTKTSATAIDHATDHDLESEEEVTVKLDTTEQPEIEGISSEHSGTKDKEYATKAPTAAEGMENIRGDEENIPSATKSPITVEYTTAQQLEDENIVAVTKVPVTAEQVDTVTDKKPEEEEEEEKEDMEYTTSSSAEAVEGDNVPSVTKAPVAADEIENVTAEGEEILSVVAQSTAAPEETVGITAHSDEIPETMELTTVKSETAEDTGKIEEHVSEVVPEADIEIATSKPQASESTEETKPSEEADETLDTTIVPETSEETGTTAKLPTAQLGDEVLDVTAATETEKESEESDKPTMPEEEEELVETSTAKLPEISEHITESSTEITEPEETKEEGSQEESTELPVVSPISTESSINDTESESESTESPLEIPKEPVEHEITTVPTKTAESEEDESTEAHISTDILPVGEEESHEDTTDLSAIGPVSTDKLPEHVTEAVSADVVSEGIKETADETTEVPLEGEKYPEIMDHVTDLPTKHVESEEEVEEESPEQVTRIPVEGHVTADKLPEHITESGEEESTELPKETHVSSDELPEISTTLPTEIKKSEEEQKETHEESSELPAGGEASTSKLPEVFEHVTELPVESHEPEVAEHVTELPSESIETEDDDEEKKTHDESSELPESPEQVTKLPVKDTKSETTESTEKLFEGSEEEKEESPVLPVDVSVSTDKLLEPVTELPTKEMETEEESHELPVEGQEIPTKDTKTEDEVTESPVESHVAHELDAHVTELPTKDVESEEDVHETATELPVVVAHDVSTQGQAVEESTETASKEEESHEETTSSETAEEISPDGLLPTTSTHPLFPHLATTLPTVPIDSRIDDTNLTFTAHSTASPATSPTTSTTSSEPTTTSASQHYQPQPPIYGQPPQYGPTQYEDEYTDEDEGEVFGPGTCRYGGKLYVSAQQIPRDDPCDFCFCFRSDIICLQQSCPPPIAGCHEEPISGFCCPRYECPVSMATVLNITTSTTTTSTTLPPHFLHHSYGNNVQRNGCLINGRSYRVGEKIESTSGPCINCTCGGDGKMKCDPQACVPEPTMQQVMAVVAAGRKR